MTPMRSSVAPTGCWRGASTPSPWASAACWTTTPNWPPRRSIPEIRSAWRWSRRRRRLTRRRNFPARSASPYSAAARARASWPTSCRPRVERLEPALWSRLTIVQQARAEDVERVRKTYAGLKVVADVAPFFPDLPTQNCGKPPRGGALRRFDGGRACARSAGPRSWCRCRTRSTRTSSPMRPFWRTPAGPSACARTSSRPTGSRPKFPRSLAEPQRLAMMAKAARSVGTLDAADRLADLVVRVAGLKMLAAPGKTK